MFEEDRAGSRLTVLSSSSKSVSSRERIKAFESGSIALGRQYFRHQGPHQVEYASQSHLKTPRSSSSFGRKTGSNTHLLAPLLQNFSKLFLKYSAVCILIACLPKLFAPKPTSNSLFAKASNSETKKPGIRCHDSSCFVADRRCSWVASWDAPAWKACRIGRRS